MALTASFTSSVVFGGSSLSGVAAISDGIITQINNDIPANNTTQTLALAFDKTKLRGIFVVSNIAANVVFGGTSNPNLQMAAGVPYVWHDASNITNPFANNCTNVRIDNNNATTNAVVQMCVVIDPT